MRMWTCSNQRRDSYSNAYLVLDLDVNVNFDVLVDVDLVSHGLVGMDVDIGACLDLAIDVCLRWRSDMQAASPLSLPACCFHLRLPAPLWQLFSAWRWHFSTIGGRLKRSGKTA